MNLEFTKFARGTIWQYKVTKFSTELKKCVILSNDNYNVSSGLVNILPIEFSNKEILVGNICTIQSSLLSEYIGRLNESSQKDIDNYLSIQFGLSPISDDYIIKNIEEPIEEVNVPIKKTSITEKGNLDRNIDDKSIFRSHSIDTTGEQYIRSHKRLTKDTVLLMIEDRKNMTLRQFAKKWNYKTASSACQSLANARDKYGL